MLAGVTRAPLLAVIMIFELTQNTAVLVPMMVVSVLAVAAAKALQKDSMYVASLRSAGIVWETTPEATALASLKVSDIMRRDVTLIARTTPLPEIVATFLKSRSLFLYVGDEEGRLLGVVDIHDIKESFPERELSNLVIAADLVTEIPFATPLEPLTSVNEKLWFRDVGQLPVVAVGHRPASFLGVVTQRDLLAAFDQRGPAAQPTGHAGAHARRRGWRRSTFWSCPRNTAWSRWTLPSRIAGLTMAEAGLRARYGVSVLAVKRMGRDGVERRFVPEPPDRFEHGDVLVVLGQRGVPRAAPGRPRAAGDVGHVRSGRETRSVIPSECYPEGAPAS